MVENFLMSDEEWFDLISQINQELNKLHSICIHLENIDKTGFTPEEMSIIISEKADEVLLGLHNQLNHAQNVLGYKISHGEENEDRI